MIQGAASPGPTTAPPIWVCSVPPPECALPDYYGDKYCDDENNNIECNWDGGACCDNTENGWDQWCSVCECLDPNAGSTTTTPKPCEDKKKTKKCKRLKNKGKCNKKRVWKKCKKTCNKC